MEFKTWLQDNPVICLAVLIALTALALLLETLSRHRRRRALRKLAAQWRMTYSPQDRLRLLARIADRLPVPGAADADVIDVIYGSLGEKYQYVFTVRYTVGVVRGKRSQVRVAGFSEARGRGGGSDARLLKLALEHLPLIEQYRSLDPREP